MPQEGKVRADYGKYLTEYIAKELEPEYGSGYSKRQIELFRQFYRTFPITNTLYSQLSWSQYKLLIRLDNQDKIDFYIAELEKSILMMEFNQQYLTKFLKDGTPSKKDLLEYYSGNDVKDRFTLIENEINNL